MKGTSGIPDNSGTTWDGSQNHAIGVPEQPALTVNRIVICTAASVRVRFTSMLPRTSGATDPRTPDAKETVLKPHGNLKQIENPM